MKKNLFPALRVAVGAACAWETVAIFTGRLPTISTLCGRHKLLVPIIIGGLTFHLIVPMKENHAH